MTDAYKGYVVAYQHTTKLFSSCIYIYIYTINACVMTSAHLIYIVHAPIYANFKEKTNLQKNITSFYISLHNLAAVALTSNWGT